MQREPTSLDRPQLYHPRRDVRVAFDEPLDPVTLNDLKQSSLDRVAGVGRNHLFKDTEPIDSQVTFLFLKIFHGT